ncbi:MAG: TolC family protein [Opitutaceae bacterium]|jgi:outer membrane protein TolC|nr:TolC family protein [Opitutaceae bacterium]
MRPAARLLLCASLLALVSAASRGEEPPAASRPPDAAALLDAVGDAPSLRAARARAEAARARTGAAGRFPDPQLEGMYSQVERPVGGEQFPMWEVTLSQPLPKAGERAADRDRAAAAVSMAEADYAVMAGDLAADTAVALAEVDAARARAALLETQIVRTENILAALDARLASGSGRAADRLALQSRVAALRLLVEQELRLADDTLAEARGRLGLAPSAPLPAYSAPAAAEIATDALPASRLAAARASEARAMARMARASARPMTSVGLRFEREEESMGNMDTIGVAFMTELPFRARRYARAEEQAARAEEQAARAESEAAGHRARSALARAERAERLAATSARLAEETSARLDAEYDSLVRSAGAAGGLGEETSVLLALEILERQTDTRMQLIDAALTARVARAELWRHAPAPLFPTP